jgi:hypothetical protein
MLVQHMVPHIATKELSNVMSNRRLGFALHNCAKFHCKSTYNP